MKSSSTQDTDLLIVSSEEAHLRIDKLLSNHYESHSRTYFQRLIENGCVLLNGKRIKKRIVPKKGDEIEVFFQLTPEISLEPEDIPLDILYEDEHIIAVNKPVGMVVHPAPGHHSGTFVNALLSHCKNLILTDDVLRPGIVHRLDKNTSGILLAAKTNRAHQKLISLFCDRKIEKHYLAICIGKFPDNKRLNAPLGRHPTRRKEMTVLEDKGKEAITQFQTLAFNDKLSLVLVKPITGRTHQIRVHLKHLKSPILGDETYGNSKINNFYNIQRQLLHAHRLKFIHPISNVSMNLIAPIPTDMKKMILQFNSFL